MRLKKYYDTYRQAEKALTAYRNERGAMAENKGIFKMPKGSRHPGKFAVCSYIEWVNTY